MGIKEDAAEVFSVCPDCGTPVVELHSHSCPEDTNGKPRREERQQRANNDDRPDTDTVLITPTRARKGSAYAYHEIGPNGMPTCGGSGGTERNDYRRVSRKMAKRRNRSPCRSCSV